MVIFFINIAFGAALVFISFSIYLFGLIISTNFINININNIPMIKVILFDLWKTLGDKPSASEALRKKFNIIKYDHFLHEYEVADHLKRYKSLESMAKHVLKYFSIPITKETVRWFVAEKKYSYSRAKAYAGINSLLSNLSKNYKLALISNTNDFDIKVLDKWGIRKYFFRIFPSYNTKLLKPDRKAFLNVTKSLKIKPKECLFVDDNPVNISVAKKLGFKTVKFENIKQARRELKKALS